MLALCAAPLAVPLLAKLIVLTWRRTCRSKSIMDQNRAPQLAHSQMYMMGRWLPLLCPPALYMSLLLRPRGRGKGRRPLAALALATASTDQSAWLSVEAHKEKIPLCTMPNGDSDVRTDLPFLPARKRYLQGKTLFITGASRGIGRAIALRAARDGANVAIVAKTTEPHPTLPGTIHSVAQEVKRLGGRALPLAVDIRDEGRVEEAVRQTVQVFGGIDIVINNASAISLATTAATAMRRYDLMQDINARGSYCVARAALPHLLKSASPHILALSPPISLQRRWWAGHPAYTMSKMAMSMVTVGLAAEFAGRVACNSLWPRTVISTAALQAFAGDQRTSARRSTICGR